MGGIRTSGDLVAWMQLTRRMKINDAKQYVAGKLGIAVEDLCNEDVMQNVRQKFNIGDICAAADGVKGITAKSRIAYLIYRLIIYSPKHGNDRAAPGRPSASRGELAITISKLEVMR